MFASAFIIAMILLIVFGNGSTIIAFIIKKSLRQNPSYWFIVSLSVADFLTGSVLVPYVMFFYWDPLLFKDHTICTVSATFHMIFLVPTIHHLILISADRYYKLMSPLKYKSVMTIRRAIQILSILWSFQIMNTIPFITLERQYDPNCFVANFTILNDLNVHFMPSLISIVYVNIPMIFLTYFNIRTYVIASKFNEVVSREMIHGTQDDRVYITYNLGRIVVERTESSESSTTASLRLSGKSDCIDRLIN